MRLVVAAVGRLKAGPERQLAERYRDRTQTAGRATGLRGLEIVELQESRSRDAARRKIEESIALANLLRDDTVVVVLDEKGENLPTAQMADHLRRWRDEGCAECVFMIGGPDGLAANLHERADLHLAFGAATWPHQLVRIMLLEQLYRAATILAGHPYHRG